MSEIKVSVVIPVYNTAEYVAKAMESVVSQTLKDIEIIVVNDGSTDNSLAILQEYAQKDPRIKIISHLVNKGQSAARNTGMAVMTGEYFYLFDSDDILEKDCLELCYNKSKELNLDFLFFDAVVFYEDDVNRQVSFNYQRTDLLEDGVYTGPEILGILEEKKMFRDTVWLNFTKTSYFRKLNLEFYPGINHEDILFTIKLYMEAGRVSFINRCFFHRRIRNNSIMMSTFTVKNIDAILFTVRELIKYRENFSKGQQKLINIRSRRILSYAIKKCLLLDFKTILKKETEAWGLYMKCLF